jgi:hypothetical protein
MQFFAMSIKTADGSFFDLNFLHSFKPDIGINQSKMAKVYSVDWVSR